MALADTIIKGFSSRLLQERWQKGLNYELGWAKINLATAATTRNLSIHPSEI
jgi:hypothetical protein